MSERFNLFWAALLMLPLTVCGQPDSLWSRTYGGDQDDMLKAMIQTDDGFVLIGETHSFGADDIWLLKIDAEGDSLWSRTYGGEYYESPVDAIQTVDGGYAILAYFWSLVDKNCCLIKTDEDGEEEWSRIFGGLEDDLPKSLLQTDDGGFILTGFTSTYIEERGFVDKGWLIKTDSTGNQEWMKNTEDWDYPYRGRQYFVPTDIIQVDTAFVMAGNVSYFERDTVFFQDVGLAKTDRRGELISFNRLSFLDSNEEQMRFIFQTSDSSYAVGGHYENQPWFNIAYENGLFWGIIFLRGHGDNRVGLYDAIEEENSAFIGVGGGSNGIVLMEIKENYANCWERNYGRTENYLTPYSIKMIENGEYLVAGTTNLIGAGGYDFWLLRLGLGFQDKVEMSRAIGEFKGLMAYPNPFNSSTRIAFYLPQSGFVNFTIYNSVGQKIQGFSGTYQQGENNIVFNVKNIPSGVYFARIESNQFSKTQRLYLVK